jgi:NAD-reducing hydrogenase small subunit
VTGNVPALRNSIGAEPVLQRAYLDPSLFNPQLPSSGVPRLLPVVRPVHSVVNVDVYIPGCPPSASTILYVLTELLAGRTPDLSKKTRFGA